MIIGKCGALQDHNRNQQFLSKENTTKNNETYLLTSNFEFNTMTTKWGAIMAEDLEAVELQEIYQQADAKGRKKLVSAAAQLLKAQKSFEDTPDDALIDEGRGNLSCGAGSIA
jgi:hypothetical protein